MGDYEVHQLEDIVHCNTVNPAKHSCQWTMVRVLLLMMLLSAYRKGIDGFITNWTPRQVWHLFILAEWKVKEGCCCKSKRKRECVYVCEGREREIKKRHAWDERKEHKWKGRETPWPVRFPFYATHQRHSLSCLTFTRVPARFIVISKASSFLRIHHGNGAKTSLLHFNWWYSAQTQKGLLLLLVRSCIAIR